MKRVLCILFVSVLTLSMIVGCGQAKSKERESIKFALWAGGDELKEFEEIVTRVNEKAKDYQIEVVSIPSDYYVKIQTMIAGKQSPDLIWLSQEHIPAYADLGALYDITELNKKGRFPKDKFYENIIRTAIHKDKLYGLPWIASPVITYINQDLFDQEGIALPNENWTWDTFMETAKALTKDTDGDNKMDQYGFIINGWPPLEMFLWAEGGDVLDKDYQVILSSDESIKGLDLLHTVLTSGISPERTVIDNNGFSEMFKAGKIAMFMGGAADNFEKEVDFKVRHLPVPKGSAGHYTFNWTASTVISKQSKNPKLAYKAMEDMTEEFFKWKVAPPLKGATANILEFAPHKEAALPTIERSLEIARSGYYNKFSAEIGGKVWENLYDPMLREKDYDYQKAANDIAELIKDIMSK